jgi:hypothetical protein
MKKGLLELRPITMSEMRTHVAELETLMGSLDRDEIHCIYFGNRKKFAKGIEQNMDMLDVLPTAGGLQFRICALMYGGMTGSGQYFPHHIDGRRSAMTAFLDCAITRLFEIRTRKIRFPKVEGFMSVEEADFGFFSPKSPTGE